MEKEKTQARKIEVKDVKIEKESGPAKEKPVKVERPQIRPETKIEVRDVTPEARAAEPVVEQVPPEIKAQLKVAERSIVTPGEVLVDGLGFLPSDGAYRDGDKIRAELLGLVNLKGRAVKIIPVSGRYIPQERDLVIGVVTEVRHSSWTVDVHSPFSGSLSLSDAVDRYVERGEDLNKYYTIGDTVLAQVVKVGDIAHLSMRGQGLRKLREGRIIEVTPAKVPRIIGKGGSMVNVLKDGTGCSIVIGRNGLIWIKGEQDKEQLAINAIKKIEEEAHTSGLTDKIKEMLKIN